MLATLPPPPADAAPAQLLQWEHHIVYSPSYRDPVMYFAVHDQHGTPLSPAAALAALNISSGGGGDAPEISHQAAAATPPAVSQEHHPFLHRPFYMLHPCQTDAVMALLVQEQYSDACTLSIGVASEESLSPKSGVDARAQYTPLQYLVAWMSVMGQPLGVAPSIDLWQSCCKSAS